MRNLTSPKRQIRSDDTTSADDRPGIIARFQRSYISALCLTASLLLILGLFVRGGLRDQRQDAFFVNLAGRQRMLSQQLTKQILLHQSQPSQLQERIEESIDQLEKAHQLLVLRRKSEEAEVRMSALEPNKLKLVSSVEAFVRSPGSRELAAVLEAEQRFLEKMEPLVKAFEDEAAERVELQMRLQWGILVLLLAVLLVEGLTIFRPLVASLRLTLDRLHGARLDSDLALERALESDRLKSTFLANISHEIRTPLNGIIGSFQLISESTSEAERDEYIEVVNRSGNALLKIVSDILDMSKIQSGQFELYIQPFSPSQVLCDLVEMERSTAQKKGLELRLEVDDRAQGQFMGDEVRVRQVLHNLLNNALKFTSEGEVRVNLRLSQEGLEYLVEDTGPGIPEDEVETALSPFRQLDHGNERVHQGTGLGLSICSHLLQLMGSELRLGRTLEGGTSCRFVLKLEAVGNAKPSTDCASGEQVLADTFSGRVLVVEDLPLNQKVVVRFLQKLGLETEVVHNGLEALEMLKSQGFDLVLMDIQMPLLDGLEATRQLRRLGVRTPVVALTANASQTDREQCSAAGMDDFLTKPLRIPQLKKVCQRFLVTKD